VRITLGFYFIRYLGVTSSHPIFSISKGDWQLAGELEVGEEVLAMGGNIRLRSKERNHTIQPVYNLEVKHLHNFLVGDVGVVVHNTPNCYTKSEELLKSLKINDRLKTPGKHKINDGPNSDKIKSKFNKDRNKQIEICFDDTGMPDFSEFVPKINGKRLEVTIDDLIGSHDSGPNGDYAKAAGKLCEELGIPLQSFHGSGSSFPGSDGIKWTWHHHQDGKTMQLIPTDINSKAGHLGVAKIIQKGAQGAYPSPGKISKKGCK
jgi:hypothetical protein